MSEAERSIARPVSQARANDAAASRTRLLLEGRIVPTLVRLAPANVVVNVVLIASTVTIDAPFVGMLGAPALAGLSLVFPLTFDTASQSSASVMRPSAKSA